MAEVELAWAAGFFDGEGSSYASPLATTAKQRAYVRLRASQKHREVLDRLASAVGAGSVTGPHADGMHTWQVQAKAAVERVMHDLWPYLGSVKRGQYEAAVQRAKERNNLVG